MKVFYHNGADGECASFWNKELVEEYYGKDELFGHMKTSECMVPENLRDLPILSIYHDVNCSKQEYEDYRAKCILERLTRKRNNA